MIAYLCTDSKNLNFKYIDWSNTWCLSSTSEEALKARHPDGAVLKIDMDDEDVIQAVLACMHGNSCKVEVSILELISTDNAVPAKTEADFAAELV